MALFIFKIFIVLIFIGAAWLARTISITQIFEIGHYINLYQEFTQTRFYKIVNLIFFIGCIIGAIIIGFYFRINGQGLTLNFIGVFIYCLCLIAQQVLLDMPRRRWLKSTRQ